jgi:hypothetical protein
MYLSTFLLRQDLTRAWQQLHHPSLRQWHLGFKKQHLGVEKQQTAVVELLLDRGKARSNRFRDLEQPGWR